MKPLTKDKKITNIEYKKYHFLKRKIKEPGRDCS